MNNNFNLDENAMNNIKNMVDNGDISGAISKISPEMIENFSKMLNNQNNSNNNSVNSNSSTASNTSANSENKEFNFNNIDPATIMKISSVLGNINNKNDSRTNLLYSLKPYLRQSRKEKIDQYANLLNISKIAELLNNDKKEK